ncbi:MAG: hypothetical protein ACK5IJ_04615 [Mangrovibacterium sp.]
MGELLFNLPDHELQKRAQPGEGLERKSFCGGTKQKIEAKSPTAGRWNAVGRNAGTPKIESKTRRKNEKKAEMLNLNSVAKGSYCM